jgi:hypothetical protein
MISHKARTTMGLLAASATLLFSVVSGTIFAQTAPVSGAQQIDINAVRCFSNGCFILPGGNWPPGMGVPVVISGGAATSPVSQVPTPQAPTPGFPNTGTTVAPNNPANNPANNPNLGLFGYISQTPFSQLSYICANGLRLGPSGIYADPCMAVGSVTVARG